MNFEKILGDVMEQDNGLILSVTAYERMMEEREPARGRTARFFDFLRTRSWKIKARKGADLGVLDGRNETCH